MKSLLRRVFEQFRDRNAVNERLVDCTRVRNVYENSAEAHGKKKRRLHFLFDCEEYKHAAYYPHHNLLPSEFSKILKKAAANIRKFHEKQVRNSFIINDENGILMGQKVIPVDRAGLYVPGGTAAYPSTVLMDSIPAKIAGCKEVAIVTPPHPFMGSHC